MRKGFAAYAEECRLRGFADPDSWDGVWEDPVERFAIGLYCKTYMTPEDLAGTYDREAGRAEMLKAWASSDHEMQVKQRKLYRRWAAALGPLTVRRPTGA